MKQVVGWVVLVLWALAFGVAQANPADAADSKAAPPGDALADFAATEEECRQRDGLWGSGGGLPRPGQRFFCLLPSAKAGRACASSSECAGTACLAPSPGVRASGPARRVLGACAKYQIGGGCKSVVENGVVRPVTCHD